MFEQDEMRVEFMLQGFYQIIVPMGGYDIIFQLNDPYSQGSRKTWLRVFHNKIDVTKDVLSADMPVDLRPTGENFWGLLNIIRVKIAQAEKEEEQI
jgi:hypothetical protein